MSEEKKLLTGLLKKAMQTGLGAALLTEETIRGAISDLPNKESISGLLQSAKETKDDFISSVKQEVGSYLKKIDLQSEIDRILESYDIEVNAKVKFKRKKDQE